MTILTFTLAVLATSLVAGLLGALTGLGGGVVVTPVLALLFHVDLRYAIGASLISVIATSSGAASAYVREGYTNVRIGLFLEIATTMGAFGGAHLAARTPTGVLSVILGAVLLYSAYSSLRLHPDHVTGAAGDPLAERLRLNGHYPVEGRTENYVVHRVKSGF